MQYLRRTRPVAYVCHRMACFAASLLVCLWGSCAALWAADGPYFASGIKIGEVTQSSGLVWLRLSQQPTANFDVLPILSEGLESTEKSATQMPTNVVPGMSGQARVVYWPANNNTTKLETSWVDVSEATDFTHQFSLEDLLPGTRYQISVQSRAAPGTPGASVEGTFQTAPLQTSTEPVRFIVSTCQAIRSIDSGTDGHQAYSKMLSFKPNFFVHTGDIVYYDKAPFSRNQAQARAKWHLIFAYGNQREFFRQVPAYFMKDDHDTLKDDCWSGQTYGDLTFDQGLAIFREQTPMRENTFRTARWGKHVQVWMTENRDFRSPNRIPDGPQKTILGAHQKAWLKQSVAESDATYKFIISPGPLVGPDKPGKADNHSNAVFAHEGGELRQFLSAIPNTFVICGDRHWQYSSKDPVSGLMEFGCGPINDEHDFGGSPGHNPEYHRYFSPRGGFLGITIAEGVAQAEWFSANDPMDVDGRPKVLYTQPLAQIE